MLFKNREKENNELVLDYKMADINGDKIDDEIILTGEKPFGPQSFLVNNITINIRDGKNQTLYKIIPKENSGYNPKLFLGDLTNNGINDILLSIFSGSTNEESFYFIYSFKNNEKNLIFNSKEFNKLEPYKIIFEDNYKVNITNTKSFILNLKNKDQEYKDYIYDQEGKLKRPTIGSISPLISLTPIPLNNTNFFKLQAKQKLIGYYSSDILGELTTELIFNGKEFIISNDNITLHQ